MNSAQKAIDTGLFRYVQHPAKKYLNVYLTNTEEKTHETCHLFDA